MAYKTLAELVEAGRAAIAAERAAADKWVREQPQREAAAAAAFVDYMKKQHDVLIYPDDTPVVASEGHTSVGATLIYYVVRLILPGLTSYVQTDITIDAVSGVNRTAPWLPVAQDNRGTLHDDLTAALLWLTAGEPLTEAGVAVDVMELVER